MRIGRVNHGERETVLGGTAYREVGVVVGTLGVAFLGLTRYLLSGSERGVTERGPTLRDE